VVYRALILCALICCTLVTLSFALFAVDQASSASKQQVAQLAAGSAPSPASAAPPPVKPKQPRKFIDGAAGTLTSPFRSLVDSSSQWTLEIFSTLVALLVYGFGLGYLARLWRLR
jgi:hypothetical protein